MLVVRPDNLGDVIMTGPALAALRRGLPAARIELLAAPAGAAAAVLLRPWLDDVVIAQVSWQQLDPRSDIDDTDLVRELARRRYDVALILTSFSQSPWPAGYVCRLAGIPVRAGMSKEFGGTGLTHWVPSPPDERHQVDRALHLLTRLGIPGADPRPDPELPVVEVPAAAVAAAGGAARRAVGPLRRYGVLLPGASCPSRRYPAARFRDVARGLVAAGVPVIVAGTERERDLVGQVVAGVPGAVALAGVLDVPALAALLAGADVVVSNNSGGVHLADAVRAPLVVLFAGTESVAQYAPRRTRATVLTVPTGCAPCRQLNCPFDLPCLDVAPEQVVTAALALADGRAGSDAPTSRSRPGRR